MKTAVKQRRLLMLDQMYLSMIEYPQHDWHTVIGHKRLSYRRATAGPFILKLLDVELAGFPSTILEKI